MDEYTDDLIVVNNQISKMEDDIYELWQNVVLPAAEDGNFPLLNDMYQSDFGDFFEFMIINNRGYDKLMKLKFKLEKKSVNM